jgi:pyruvate dehydrogenase E2 component (dihydrolipoamide acetyltransferase)
MAFEFHLPDVGEGVVEAEILTWMVAEGDVIEVDQPIVEISTDKVVVEIPSPVAGTVVDIRFKVGQICPVHDVLVVIEDGAAGADEAATTDDGGAEPTPEATPAAPVTPAAPAGEGGKVLAIPSTRRLARELGIDLAQVPSTGAGGRVTSDDVKRYFEAEASPDGSLPKAEVPAKTAPAPDTAAAPIRLTTPATRPDMPAVPAGEETRIPMRGARRAIAENMVRSKFTATHFTYVEEVDVTELVELRDRIKDQAAERGVKLTYLSFITRAIAEGLKKWPALNASLDEDKQEIVRKGWIHMGIAVQGPHGLVVTVVRDADQLTILQLQAEIARLSDAVANGTIKRDEMMGSTFTISSLGVLGGVMATPIINHPEVGIVGVHRIAQRPAVVDGAIVPRWLMNLSISLDHRVVDGWDGAMFLQDVKSSLESPLGLLLGGGR